MCRYQSVSLFSVQSTGLDFRRKEAAGWARIVNAIM